MQHQRNIRTGLGVLSSHFETPGMTQTALALDLLEPLQIVTQAHVEILGDGVVVPAGLEVLAPVDEPHRDLVLERVGNNLCQLLNLLHSQGTSTLVQVDVGLLADEGGDSPTHTLDGGQGVDDLPLSVNVGVANTQNVLEALLGDDKGLHSVQYGHHWTKASELVQFEFVGKIMCVTQSALLCSAPLIFLLLHCSTATNTPCCSCDSLANFHCQNRTHCWSAKYPSSPNPL